MVWDYNVVHPFESSIPIGNREVWEVVLKDVIEEVEEKGWRPNPGIPDR
jgi:hypothetical protein